MSELLAPKGHHTWTGEEVYQFGERWPVGATQRLAIGLLLWTGARRSEVVILGRQHERIFSNEHGEPEQWLYWKIEKGKKRKPKRAEIPLLPELRELLDASPVGDLTYLISQRGRPFSAASFGTRFRAWCDTPVCSIAVRTACARRARASLSRTARPNRNCRRFAAGTR